MACSYCWTVNRNFDSSVEAGASPRLEHERDVRVEGLERPLFGPQEPGGQEPVAFDISRCFALVRVERVDRS